MLIHFGYYNNLVTFETNKLPTFADFYDSQDLFLIESLLIEIQEFISEHLV